MPREWMMSDIVPPQLGLGPGICRGSRSRPAAALTRHSGGSPCGLVGSLLQAPQALRPDVDVEVLDVDVDLVRRRCRRTRNLDCPG